LGERDANRRAGGLFRLATAQVNSPVPTWN
jgi:hypothetical protein